MTMHKIFLLLLVLAIGAGVTLAAEKAEEKKSKVEATEDTTEEEAAAQDRRGEFSPRLRSIAESYRHQCGFHLSAGEAHHVARRI